MKEENTATAKKPFLSDVLELRRRARESMLEGAVTSSYQADRAKTIEVLNVALATEIVCVLRYKKHYFAATGIHAESVAEEFQQHAKEEQEHADRIAERINQLGGDPDLNPQHLAMKSHTEYSEGNTLLDMIREDLVAERVAIESYTEIVRWLGDGDPTTRRLLESILEKEEEHAEDMRDLLATLDPAKPDQAPKLR
jgi:bacterioferritin